jgi:hypothetical protein
MTTDVRDFSRYRLAGRKTFEIILGIRGAGSYLPVAD